MEKQKKPKNKPLLLLFSGFWNLSQAFQLGGSGLNLEIQTEVQP